MRQLLHKYNTPLYLEAEQRKVGKDKRRPLTHLKIFGSAIARTVMPEPAHDDGQDEGPGGGKERLELPARDAERNVLGRVIGLSAGAGVMMQTILRLRSRR